MVLSRKPGSVVYLRHNKQFVQIPPAKPDRNMVFRFIAESGYDQAFRVSLARSAVGDKEVIKLLTADELDDPGQALAILPWFPVSAELFSRCPAEMLVKRRLVVFCFLLLRPVMQCPAERFICEVQELRDVDVDMDVVKLPLACLR